jgi:hypothetical protein
VLGTNVLGLHFNHVVVHWCQLPFMVETLISIEECLCSHSEVIQNSFETLNVIKSYFHLKSIQLDREIPFPLLQQQYDDLPIDGRVYNQRFQESHLNRTIK